MKRESSGQNDSPASKLPKPSSELTNVVIRFLIPARAAGIMIGKGGENIKKIRSQYNVKLNIPDSRGPERIMTIEGDLQSICKIMLEVSPRLKDIMNAKLSDPRRITGGSNFRRRKLNDQGEEVDKDEEDDTMLDYRILVHESQAGSVIGRGGERIKELRSKYRMRVIKVYQMLAPMSSDRVVQMVADPENAIQCLKSVVEAVESAPPRGIREDYDAANFSEMDALNYGGWMTREAMEAMAQGPPPHRGQGNMPPNYMGGGGGGGHYMMGGPDGMPPVGAGGGGGRGPRPPMGGGGASGYRSGYAPPRGAPAMPPPGPRSGGGGYSNSGSAYDGGAAPAGYDDAPYDGGLYGSRGLGEQGYGGPQYGAPSAGSGNYGSSGYSNSRQPVDSAPPGMPRGGSYGGYGAPVAVPHDDQKANQWYGGWS